jgi:chromodomain helicase DNA binding protein 8
MDIWMPDMEQQEVPAGWWDTAADRSLLVGVFKHGEQGGGRHMVLGSG